MRLIWIVISCGFFGYWMSGQYEFPAWLLWPLLLLGTSLWAVAKIAEHREESRKQS